MSKVRVMNIVGARPNFMKIAPIIDAIKRRSDQIEQVLVHTGQHYDEAMSDAFFRDLEIPKPDENLNVGSGTHAEQTARIMLAFEPVLLRYRPDWVLVVGDVNSTLACTLVSSKLSTKVCHVEAGLRSFDRSMPEEVNRLVTDALADLLLTPSRDADVNLLREGIDPDRIRFVGNVMIDTLYRMLPKTDQCDILERLELEEQNFCVVTMHRPSNVDDPTLFPKQLAAIAEIANDCPCIFPIHPRTRTRIREFGLEELINETTGLRLIEPLGYLDFLALFSKARLVLTDSGGLQEETSVLGIPCLTMRENTERPVTVEQGTNHLVGTDPQAILAAARRALADGKRRPAQIEYWDGKASERIVDTLLE